jgi:hypothetical protein
MIIKPYSTLAAETFAAADFPALKHFWACKDGAVANLGLLLDVAGDADITANGALTASGNGIVLPAAAHTATGLTDPGGAACLFMVCGTWGATGTISYGSTSSAGFSVGTQAAGAKFIDGETSQTRTTDVSVNAQTASAAFTRVAAISSTGGVMQQGRMFEVNSTTLDANIATQIVDFTDATPLASITSLTAAITGVASSHTVFGMAFFKFAGALPPIDVIQAAAAWCDYQWRNNANVTMYPGFKGIA